MTAHRSPAFDPERSRTQFLLDASAALAEAADYRGAFSALARIAVPSYADWCVVHATDGPGRRVRPLATAHAEPALAAVLRDIGRRCPPGDRAGAIGHALAGGGSRVVAHTDSATAAAATFGCKPAPELTAALDAVGFASLLVIPLSLGVGAAGALTWGRGPAAPPFDAADLGCAEALAGHASAVLAVARRLEAERQARADDEAARQQLASAVDDSPDGFCALDRERRVTYLNAAAARLWGVSRDAALGRPIAEVVAGERDGRFHEEIARALRDGTVAEYETYFAGVEQWCSVRAVPTRLGTSVYLRDVTVRRTADGERERLLSEAERARAAAEQANRSKSDFLASMSHELRTPLNAILGYVALLADGITGPVTPTQSRHLGRVRASAQHLLALIEEVLAFARIEAGTESVRLEPWDARDAAREAADLVEPVIESRGLRFHVHMPDGPAPAVMDVRKVRQILLNLLANAARFTRPGGEVTLVARVDDARAWFEVRDTGVGIAPEHLERIFEPFWQVEQNLTREAGGTGLGLSVSRRFARLLGGDITVESTPGAGSVFVVVLPREHPESRGTAPAADRDRAVQ